MELFEYKKSIAFIKYLSANVINILDKSKHPSIRKELKELYNINFFNLLSKDRESAQIMIKTKDSVKLFTVYLDGNVIMKGERSVVNATKNS